MAQLTILNSMAGQDFEHALDQHLAWNLEVLDLKNAIFGKDIANLSNDEARRAADLIRQRGLSVYNFSTMFFFADVANGETWFRRQYVEKVDRVVEIAHILQPTMIRLIGAEIADRDQVGDSIAYLDQYHPWLIPLYQEVIDRIAAAGYRVTIENETGRCIFASPAEVTAFFERLDRQEQACFTWDVQNMWELGTFPSLDAYEQIKPWIGFYHVKGGQQEGASPRLRWRSSLADASWPVVEITQRIVDDGVSPVICLNPSHGAVRAGYNDSDVVKQDIDYLRNHVSGIR